MNALKRKKNFIKSLSVFTCISCLTILGWTTDIIRFGTYGNNTAIPKLNQSSKAPKFERIILKCKNSPLFESWKNNRTNNSINDMNILIKDSVSPRACMKSTSNKLSWSIKPESCDDDIFLVWLIKSSIYRNTLRKNIRNFWAKEMNYNISGRVYKTKRLFLIGSDPQNNTMPTIELENQLYNDILQGTFEDSFKCVTKKTVLGMQFVTKHCTSAQYIVVVDDDATVIPWNLFKYLPSYSTLQDGQYFGGFFLHGKQPVRDKNSRWYMPESDYRCRDYPVYPLGTGFFMSKCTMDQMYEMATEMHLFGIDDVLVGGIAHELGIKITEIEFSNRYAECGSLIQSHNSQSMKNIVICHGTDYPHDQLLLWTEFCHAPLVDPNFAQYYIEYCKDFL